MEIDKFHVLHEFPISEEVSSDLGILCDIFNCPINLLIESFISRPSYPEEAFPHYYAECFLDFVGESIRVSPMMHIVSCTVEGNILYVTTMVTRSALLDWI